MFAACGLVAEFLWSPLQNNWRAGQFAKPVVRVHVNLHSPRLSHKYLHALNNWLPRHVAFIDEISAATLEDELSLWEVGSTDRHGVTQFEGQTMAINVLDDANDPRAIKIDT